MYLYSKSKSLNICFNMNFTLIILFLSLYLLSATLYSYGDSLKDNILRVSVDCMHEMFNRTSFWEKIKQSVILWNLSADFRLNTIALG